MSTVFLALKVTSNLAVGQIPLVLLLLSFNQLIALELAKSFEDNCCRGPAKAVTGEFGLLPLLHARLQFLCQISLDRSSLIDVASSRRYYVLLLRTWENCYRNFLIEKV